MGDLAGNVHKTEATAAAHEVTHLMQVALTLPLRLRRRHSVGLLSVDQVHGQPGALVCENQDGERTSLLMETCHMLSVGILIIFFAENLLKMSVHFQEFSRRPLHILDFVVVTVSLICDGIIA